MAPNSPSSEGIAGGLHVLMGVVLLANAFLAPRIRERSGWNAVLGALRRDLPWLGSEHHVVLSGVGQDWTGWQHRGHVASHARFSATRSVALNAVLAWLTQLVDCLSHAQRGPVVAFSPAPYAALGCTLAGVAYRRNVSSVVRVQGITASKPRSALWAAGRGALIRAIERFVLSQADLVLPMGRFTAQSALDRGAKSESTVILPFPVDWAERARVTPLPSTPQVLYAGRLEREKGLSLLLRAISRVGGSVPDVRLRIAGDGGARGELEQLAQRLEIAKRVTFLGWLESDQLQREYRQARVVVLPSIWEEGLGMVLVEAGLMARPVIASDIGGIRDVVEHLHTGILVSPGNVFELAESIETLLLDHTSSTQLGLAGRSAAIAYLESRRDGLRQSEQRIRELLQGRMRTA